MSDVLIFLVVLFLFIAGFALQVTCVYSPLREPHQPGLISAGAYSANFEEVTGQKISNITINPAVVNRKKRHDDEIYEEDDVLAEAQSTILRYIKHANLEKRSKRFRRQSNTTEQVVGTEDADGPAFRQEFTFTKDEIEGLDLALLGDSYISTTLESGEELIRVYKCPAPGPKMHAKIVYEPVEEYSNEDGTTVIKLFTIFFFALYGIGNPNVLPKVARGPYWGQHITKM